eukprot:CAMPEP_0184747158 /NCGR_PEP_ID=MMETSP0315-20130426/9519_1 /TAXON_ID=101924 /ORGANISM="Rhodosorus marinus, Strain UTEX LB 2760" /LENGTH=221 /DNA_ID=CAMNT_0027219925 /DNA_START=596 /DNA_END=1258 /DNA_ORIENTATION=+
MNISEASIQLAATDFGRVGHPERAVPTDVALSAIFVLQIRGRAFHRRLCCFRLFKKLRLQVNDTITSSPIAANDYPGNAAVDAGIVFPVTPHSAISTCAAAPRAFNKRKSSQAPDTTLKAADMLDTPLHRVVLFVPDVEVRLEAELWLRVAGNQAGPRSIRFVKGACPYPPCPGGGGPYPPWPGDGGPYPPWPGGGGPYPPWPGGGGPYPPWPGGGGPYPP